MGLDTKTDRLTDRQPQFYSALPGWRSIESETVKYGHESRRTTLAKANSNCKRQTSPLVREGAPQQQTHDCLTVTKFCSWPPDECLTPRQTGRLTVGRNITFT
jgi:hypothetical protein